MNKLILLASCLILFSCSNSSNSDETENLLTSDTLDLNLEDPKHQENQVEEARVRVKIETSYGVMICELYNETPQHRDNFLKLIGEKFYDDLLFHRVMKGFMIQGGDPNSRGAAISTPLGDGGPGYTIPAEMDQRFYHKKGALCAARQGDHVNPMKRSSGSQFYIVQGEVYKSDMFGSQYPPNMVEDYCSIGGTPGLDLQYTVFGEVIEGMDVIDKIAGVEVFMDKSPTPNKPKKNVSMTISLVE